MNFFNEYALLIAVALPVVVLVGIQLFLFISGERDTLLFPGLNRYPSIDFDTRSHAAMMKLAEMPAATNASVARESSNDAMEREAA
jgi:hypothetical protein